MPGEAAADTGLGKATGRAGERPRAPEAVVDAEAGRGATGGPAAADFGDMTLLLSSE